MKSDKKQSCMETYARIMTLENTVFGKANTMNKEDIYIESRNYKQSYRCKNWCQQIIENRL